MNRGFINNEWDRDNLEFLLKTGEKELNEWYSQATADDLAYAQELLAAHGRELQCQTQELLVEAELELKGFQQSRDILAKFML